MAALGSHAPPQAANKATEQAGHQAGTAAALAYASQLVARGKGPAAITFASEIARRNLEQAGDPVVSHDRPSEASSSGGSNKRQRKRAPGGQKRARPLTEEEKQRIRAARPQNKPCPPLTVSASVGWVRSSCDAFRGCCCRSFASGPLQSSSWTAPWPQTATARRTCTSRQQTDVSRSRARDCAQVKCRCCCTCGAARVITGTWKDSA